MLPAIIGAAGAVADHFLAKEAANKQYKQQKEFAQSGIQWRVKDAEKAGIHPLYALGAQTTSYSPVSVGGGSFADVGQNIGRAIDSTRSNPAKAEALANTASQIQLEGLQLDNEIKRAQLASAHALARQSSNPGLPGVLTRAAVDGMPGQGDAPQVEDRVMSPQFTPYLRAFGGARSTTGGFSDAQAYEDRYGELSDYIMGPTILMSDIERQRQEHFKHQVLPKMRQEGRIGSRGRYYWDWKGTGRR